MLLLMVDEPLVIVVKLADRLHNMRTAYALAPNKRQAVATETLEVWCTLAERLGMFAIKVISGALRAERILAFNLTHSDSLVGAR